MALLTRPMRSLGGFNALLAVAFVTAAAGCVILDSMFGQPTGFNHSLHYDVGLECADCHGDGPEPMPAELDTCLMCHEDMDPDQPVELRAVTIMEAMQPRTPWAQDVLFTHDGHTTAGLECNTCHVGIEESEGPGAAGLIMDMASCASCHEQQGMATAQCQTCHSELTTEVPPDNHAHNWPRFHGQVVRSESEHTADDCAMCHTQQSCMECHREVAPANHNNTFRLRTHGVAATMDRENCEACHRQDSCVSCHNEVRPLSHRGSFGGSRSTHCLGCHFPVSEQSCSVCHKGTPSHFMATPKPPDHNPAMNCRQCHGAGEALPHVDDGSNCNFCHK